MENVLHYVLGILIKTFFTFLGTAIYYDKDIFSTQFNNMLAIKIEGNITYLYSREWKPYQKNK